MFDQQKGFGFLGCDGLRSIFNKDVFLMKAHLKDIMNFFINWSILEILEIFEIWGLPSMIHWLSGWPELGWPSSPTALQ